MNLKQELLKSKPKKLEIDGLPALYIKPLTFGEYRQFLDRENAEDSEMDVMREFVAQVLVDEHGKKVFDDPNELESMPFATFQKIVAAASEAADLNAMALEEAKKN